jgi:lipopolysaccharide heptosyltransferase III
MKADHKALRYLMDRSFRTGIMWIMNRITVAPSVQKTDIRGEEIRKILLVRGLFRLGDSILATPAILLLRENFPTAMIDFVGPRMASRLFQKLPIAHYYEIHRTFPKACWSYFALLRRLRRAKYDLAVDVSGSSAAMGSFIVGFSGARLRAGVRGKWDRWYNIRIARASLNKYRNLPELISAMGLASRPVLPKIVLSDAEIAVAGKRLRSLVDRGDFPLVAVFVGGRKSRGKRWDREHFRELVMQLCALGTQPIVFVGPEESDTLVYLQAVLGYRVPVVFEPAVRSFAALVANCSLFVGCDSGPLHLACALGIRAVAIFLNDNFDRWGPPAELSRIVYRESGVTVTDVFEACRIELGLLCGESLGGKIVNG